MSFDIALQKAILDRSSGSHLILSSLREQGIAVLPDYLEGRMIDRLNDEFDRVINERESLGFNVTDREEGITVALVRNRLSNVEYPVITEVFTSPLMNGIARDYYEGESFALNHQIYANLNRGTQAALTELPFVPHMDKIHTLKFFIYLSDTASENGAMSVVPGSHHTNRLHRLDCLAGNSDFRAVSNLVQGITPVSVEGPAGTLIVFETDITHTAGHVLPGHERRVLRGHTRTVEEMQRLGLGKEMEGILSAD